MKKILGLTFGGLHQKILNLVLVFALALIVFFGLSELYRNSILSDTVAKAGAEQQEAITQVSENTMSRVINGSLVKTNALQAYIAEEMFKNLKNDVSTLQTLAKGLFEHQDSFAPYPYSLPDKGKNGEYSPQVLYENGVDYRNSGYLGTAAHMTDTMLAMCENSETLSAVYIGLSDGTYLCVDDSSAAKYDEDGKLIPFAVRQRPWYTGAVEAGDIRFSGVYPDSYTGELCITCSAPVYAGGELIGTVGGDLHLSSMSDYVNASMGSGGFISVINNEGKIIFAPENNGLFSVEASETADDLRNSANPELSAFITDALTASTGLRTVTVNDRPFYMAATPIGSVGRAVVSVVDKETTEEPTRLMLSEYERINGEATETFRTKTYEADMAAIVILLSVIIVGSIGVIRIAGRIVYPIEKMTENIIESSNTGKLFEMRDLYKTNDEIEVLAEAFDELSRRTKQYIEDITEITKEKERIGTELELAHKIQADMLPNIFPPFPERNDFDIFAAMDPAKEVGGDFYDFFLTDSDHLCMVMADVSGKGVPAALFMMMSKILIHNFAMMNNSPGKVLELTNNAICQNNVEEMFVTVWLGILELSTGTITAANAGHEFPIIRKPGGDYELLEDKHGFVVGGLKNMKFKEYEIHLDKGGSVFLYTDGVAEAVNSEEEQFGTDRLLAVLNSNKDSTPREQLANVRASIDEFVGDADQFDDLTMLCVTLQ